MNNPKLNVIGCVIGKFFQCKRCSHIYLKFCIWYNTGFNSWSFKKPNHHKLIQCSKCLHVQL